MYGVFAANIYPIITDFKVWKQTPSENHLQVENVSCKNGCMRFLQLKTQHSFAKCIWDWILHLNFRFPPLSRQRSTIFQFQAKIIYLINKLFSFKCKARSRVGNLQPTKQFYLAHVLLCSLIRPVQPFFIIEIHKQARRNVVSFYHHHWIGCKMPNFLVIVIKSAVKCLIFRQRPFFLVRCNGGGPLEPCRVWMWSMGWKGCRPLNYMNKTFGYQQIQEFRSLCVV